MFRSLRARVTVLATLVLVVVLGLASLLIVSLVRQQVVSDLAEQNERTLSDIALRIEAGEDPRTINLPLGSDGTEYVIIDDNGEYVQATIFYAEAEFVDLNQLPEEFFLESELQGNFAEEVIIDEGLVGADFVNLVEFEESIAYAAAPDGRRFQVIGYTPTQIIERSVSQVRSVLWLVIPLLAVLFAALTWLLTSRMLRPVAEMTVRANDIRTDTLHERLVEPGTGDEIDQLAVTLNSMLDRLDAGARQQKQFVSDASHELKSPLTVMIGEAELARGSKDPARLMEANERMVQHGHKMSALIDDLLALARTGEFAHRHEVDLDDVIRSQAAVQDHTVDTTEVEPARLIGDGEALSRLVRNLVENAVRHARGTVKVSCRVAGDRVEMNVDDDGPGIPTEHRERVLERFARLDESRTRTTGGSGLGLAISKAIVEAHDGKLVVGESPLGGARLCVTLPISIP